MNLIAELFGGRAWAQAVWSLVHSLWQAAAIAGAVALVLGRLPARRVRARHAAALAGFALAALAPLATFAVLEARHDLRAGDAWASAGDTPPAPPAPAAGAARADGAPAAERAAPAGPRDAGGSGRSAPAPAGPAWTPFAAAAWLAGATAMLLRTGLGLVSARRLLASPPLPPEHAAALGVEELSARLGLRSWPGRVRVAVTDRVAAPAVAGILHPMILLPPAQLAALGDAQLRAVLAHELAHVVRGDLIVGLAQRVVEACLFFNPAVLWLGARLRAEREACCDAMAAEATGGSRGVAETLARSALAARGGAGWTPALGLASGGRGALRERVARLLAPEARFPAHVPWPTFAAFVLASVVAIAGLGAGAAAVGQAAAGLLDPERHVARAAEIRREFGQRTGLAVDAPEQRVRVSGRVRTADGAPLPADVRLMGSVRTPGHDVGVGAEIGADGSFSAAWPWGRIDLAVVADGYAPAAAEGLAPEPGGAIEGLELVLERGFSMTVRLVDPGGNPVPGAEVAKSQVFAGFHVGERTATTDDRGTTAFEHLGAAPVDLTIRAPGFERERLRIEPVPGGVAEATLTPSIPLRARLVEAGSGRPLAGADVRLAYDSGEPVRMFDPRRGFEEPPLVGTTDADGRLEADGLRRDAEYGFWIRDAAGLRLLRGVRVSAGPQTLPVHRPLRIEGTVSGDPGSLPKRSGRPAIAYTNPWRFSVGDGTHEVRTSAWASVDPESGRFVLEDLVPGDVFVTAGSRSVRLDAERAGEAVTIDLDAVAPTRRVVVRLVPPEGWPPPEGRLDVAVLNPLTNVYETREAEVVRGEAELDVPLGEGAGGVRIFGSTPAGLRLAGDAEAVRVPPGEAPLVIERAVEPAGTIYGRVLNADGAPAHGVRLTLVATERPEGAPPLAEPAASEGDGGRFVFDGVPLAGAWRVVASPRGNPSQRAVSEEVRLSAEAPTADVTVRLTGGRPLEVTILHPDGRPAAGVPVRLVYRTPWNYQFSGEAVQADAGGRVSWASVAPEAPGTHEIVVEPADGRRGARERVDFGAPAMTVRLREGLRASGVVIDAETGRPIPNARLRLHPIGQTPGPAFDGPVLVTTDAGGRFRVGSLEPRRYAVHADGLVHAGAAYVPDGAGSWRIAPDAPRPDGPQTIGPGDEDRRLVFSIPPWSDLRPLPAGDAE